MFRVTIQGSLVALQHHMRAKSTHQRERSLSPEDTTATLSDVPIPPQQLTQEHITASNYQFAAPVSVGWHCYPRADERITVMPQKIESLTDDGTPSATYSYAPRETIINFVCCFLEYASNLHEPVEANPHGWECLRVHDISPIPESSIPSCRSNSCNNYNKAHPSCGDMFHYLFCTTTPTIAMHDYLMRLTEYFRTTDSVFITATYYFKKAIVAYREKYSSKGPLVTPWSLHRLYFVCCVLAAKWFEDIPFDNQYYASVGGISTFELTNIESAVLNLLDFSLFADHNIVNNSWETLQEVNKTYNSTKIYDAKKLYDNINCLRSRASERPNNNTWYHQITRPQFQSYAPIVSQIVSYAK